MADPDIAGEFPAWEYLHFPSRFPRPTHQARNHNYYPTGRSFAEVRGTGIEDVANCHCTFRPIFKSEWKKLLAGGISFATFAEHDVSNIHAARQQKPWSCGTGALLIVARKFGVGPSTEAELRQLLGTNATDGTPPPALVAGAKAIGLDVEAREHMTLPELERALIRGWPVLVCLQAWGSRAGVAALQSGHWAVATAGTARTSISSTSVRREDYIPRRELERRWRDRDTAGKEWERFGIVVKGVAAQP